METETSGTDKKLPKPNLNGPNSPTPERSIDDRDLNEDEQKQITNSPQQEDQEEEDDDQNRNEEENNSDVEEEEDREKKTQSGRRPSR